MCEFAIPELPRGRRLSLNIRSTWGDRYYVGLTGIELFSETGRPVKPIKVRHYVPYFKALSQVL